MSMFSNIGRTLARIIRRKHAEPVILYTEPVKYDKRPARVVTKRGLRMARSPGHPPVIPEGNWR